MLQCVFHIEGGTYVPRVNSQKWDSWVKRYIYVQFCYFHVSFYSDPVSLCPAAVTLLLPVQSVRQPQSFLKRVQIYSIEGVSSGEIHRSEICGSKDEYVILLDITKLPSKWLCQFAFPPAMGDGTCFPTALPTGYAVIRFLMFSSAMV